MPAELLDAKIKAFKRKLHRRVLRARKAVHRALHPAAAAKHVVFVLGCQRSGTTMLLATLNESAQIDVYYESDERAFESFRLRERDVVEPLIASSTATAVALKPICDSHLAPELLSAYAGSKGIWIYRDYRDVANSALAKWGNDAVDFLRWGSRQRGLSQETLDRVRRVWRPGIAPHEAFALFWYQRNHLFFDLDLANDPRVLLVRYENLVTKPQEFFPPVFAFIAVPFSKRLISRVSPASVRKNAAPRFQPGISVMCEDLMQRLDRTQAPQRLDAAMEPAGVCDPAQQGAIAPNARGDM